MRVYFTVLFVGINLCLCGQGYQDSVVYELAEDAIFMRNQETKFLLKIGNNPGVELKFGDALSLELETLPRMLANRANEAAGLGAGLGARYYYQMANRIKADKQADNLSGEYVGVMAGLGIALFQDQQDSLVVGLARAYTVSVGRQERYYKNEYFDFSINLDFLRTDGIFLNDNSIEPFSSITLRTESAYGFAFAATKEVDPSTLCAVVQCHKDRKSGFKINRNNFFALTRSESIENTFIKFQLLLNPEIGYEFKIGETSFSIAQELSTSFNFANFNGNNVQGFGLQEFEYTYRIGGRYYYNMTERVLAGQQGNNLSGDYYQAFFKHKDDNQGSVARGSFLIGGGIQKEVVDRLYF